MPKITTIDSEKPFKCVARRHMRPAMFMTYDAIMAMCKSDEDCKAGDPLIFFASEKKLANMNNRSAEQESEALKALKEAGWIVAIDDKQARFRAGRWTTNKYRVLEHDEYVKTHKCAPPRYSETGDKLEHGRMAKGLERKWISKITGVLWPDWLADVVADAIDAKKQGTATGNPVTVATFPETTAEEVLAVLAERERRKQR